MKQPLPKNINRPYRSEGALASYPHPSQVCPLALLAILLGLNHLLWGQGSGLPLGSEDYHIGTRLEIKYALMPPYHPALKMWDRGKLTRFALQIDSTAEGLSPSDRRDLYRVFKDNNEWLAHRDRPQRVGGARNGYFEKMPGDTLYRFVPLYASMASTSHPYYFRNERPIWGFFYPTPANWVELNESSFYLRLNPMIDLKAGPANSGRAMFLNRRGVELRGGFDDRVFFYSNITDTQLRWLPYVQQWVDRNKAVPGNGYYKVYDSRYFDSEGAWDILNGQAFIGMHVTDHIGVQFGHGKHFIGNGYRSLLLSDFSHNMLYFKINWEFGRLTYQNLYAELEATSAQANPSSVLIPRKYMAAHYLSWRPGPRFSLGLFEAVVFNRTNHFELGYLNPVILYRTVEHLLDSKDNILIGLDVKWDLWRRMRLYGQFLLDEFKSTEILSNDGWWANKWGWQVGVLYIDAFGIDHLDLRAEYNHVRPFTYTHEGELGASYSHYNQPLAHPLGAAFRELLCAVRWQPLRRLTLQARLLHWVQTAEPDGENWGRNILLPNESRTSDYGNEIGYPQRERVSLAGLDGSWELYHNLWFDLHAQWRHVRRLSGNAPSSESFLAAGLRLNLPMQRFDF